MSCGDILEGSHLADVLSTGIFVTVPSRSEFESVSTFENSNGLFESGDLNHVFMRVV